MRVKRFQIHAVDISARKLAVAQRGVYSANAFRGSDLSFRARYFHATPAGYEIDSSIRSTVSFAQANILAPDLLADQAAYDVIFCRNLLIYLDAPARRLVLATLKRLLSTDGLLFIGHADRLEVSGEEPGFKAVGNPAFFAYRLDPEESAPGWRPWQDVRPLSPGAELVARGGRDLHSDPIAPPAGIPVVRDARPATTDDASALPSENAGLPLLEQAAELANQGRFDDAIAICELELRTKQYSPSAYCLLGMICQAAGNRDRAEQCFHKTLYLDPIHDEALLALRYWRSGGAIIRLL